MTAATAGHALKRSVHRRLLADPDGLGRWERDELRAHLARLLRDEAPLVAGHEAARLLDELVVEIDGLGPLEPLLADEQVTEVMLNGPGRAYVERHGRLEAVPLDLDAATIHRLAERIVAPLGLRLDRASPLVDARLPDGSRVHAVLPPLAPDGPCLTIRRFVARTLTLADFGAGERAAPLLSGLVSAGWNLLVAGGTSAGKTSLVQTLAGGFEPSSRVVTIEETAELGLPLPHVVRLEARPANAEGAGAVSVRELVRTALRMRPDRIIVGEVRGGEALDLLQALNTGHDGSLCTVHASGAGDALRRLETLVLLAGVPLPLAAVRAQMHAAIDAVVLVARGAAGERTITGVAEVAASPGREPRPLLARDERGDLVPVGVPGRPTRRAGHEPTRGWTAW